ncbi:MAG TPA: hypothetical protein VGJ07_16905 [Rugosimonospora sp.]|jgi:hypothetical protein
MPLRTPPLPVDPAVLDEPRITGWPGRTIRLGAIVVLVLAALSVIGAVFPASRSAGDLTADLAAGRVSYIEFWPASHEVRWVDDWVRWRQAVVDAPGAAVPGQPVPGREEDWVRGQIDASGHPVGLVERDSNENGSELWLFKATWGPLRAAAIGVWLLTLLHMLFRRGHRAANRWAWFWMFTIGQSGVLLYLLREPVPLGRRELRPTGATPTKGGMGFAHAVLLAVGTGLVALGIAAVLR